MAKTIFRPAVISALGILLVLMLALPVSAAGTKVHWYGQAAFKIDTPSGGVILIDPWLKVPTNPDKANSINKLKRVDYILLTHAHGDHIGNSVEIAKKFGAALVTSAGLRRNIVALHGYPPKQATLVTAGNVGGRIKLPKAGAAVTIVNAVHGSEIQIKNAPKGTPAISTGGNPIGLVLEIEGGPTIYHTGDTDVFTDMKLIDEFFDVDLMLAAIGDHFTMGPTRAALAVEFVKPKMVWPMHYATFGLLTGRPAPFQAAMKARGLSTKMLNTKPGDTREF